MNAKTLAVAAVVAAAGALVAVKAARDRPAHAHASTRVGPPAVVLVADAREAESECPCGELIRRVRQAKVRGVEVLELGPTDPEAARYGVTVAPTVLFLGSDGRVVGRREGESSDVLAAVSKDLAAIETGKQ